MPNRNPSLTTSLLLPSKTQSLLLSWASFLCPLPQTVDLMLLERNRRVEREACREEEPDGYKVAFFYGHPTVSSIYLSVLCYDILALLACTILKGLLLRSGDGIHMKLVISFPTWRLLFLAAVGGSFIVQPLTWFDGFKDGSFLINKWSWWVFSADFISNYT